MKTLFIFLFFFISFKVYPYQLFRTGNSSDVRPAIQPYFCLAGGGSDEAWQEGWKQLLKNSNGGDVLIIREDKKRGGYEEWLIENRESGDFPRFNSVSTLALNGIDDSFNPKILDIVSKSEFIFFAGGFQNNYFDYIANTPLQKAIQNKINTQNVVLAGTSAGMAIMSDLAFGAHYKSPSSADGFLSSKDVLEKPLRAEVDLIEGLFQIPYLKHLIADTHFARRKREGRLMGFMANGLFKNNIIYNGLGVDEDTAFCFDANGEAKIFGDNHVYLAKPVHSPLIDVDHSLIWDQVHVKKFQANDEVDLKLWGNLYGKDLWNAKYFMIEALWQ